METVSNLFSMTTTFQAPKQLVFDAFSTAKALERWWGPVEAPIDVISLDFRPGGHFHYRMNGAQVTYGIKHYHEIDPPNSMTWVNSFADEQGNIIKPPFEGLDLPKEMLIKITLTEKDGITTLVLESKPVNANESETNTFYALKENMEQGFRGMFGQLEKDLGEK